MTDPRGDLLADHMALLGLTDHSLACALSIRVEAVRMVLAGFGWFAEPVERRLSQFLETPRDEWEPLE